MTVGMLAERTHFTLAGQALCYDIRMAPRRFTLSHSFAVISTIGWSDFVLKYRGSMLGYIWSLLSPLVRFVVILHIFGPYVSQSISNYAFYLFLGIIIWEHFAVTTSSCMGMLHDKASIIQQMVFPRVFLIFAVGWTNFVIFLTHLTIFFVTAFIFNVDMNASVIYLILTALQMTLVALGIGMLLSAYSLKYRDVPHMWAVAIQILFWLTPVMYPYTLQGGSLTHAARALLGQESVTSIIALFIQIQPLSIIIHDARRAVLYDAVSGSPTLEHAVGMTLVCATIFLFGFIVFQRRQHYFPQEY